jgi:16S rRNA (guanine1516-N2)-methyltransferase
MVVVVVLWMSERVSSWIMIPKRQQNHRHSLLLSAEAASSASSSAAVKNTCVLESETFPRAAAQVAERLSLPLLSQQDLQCLDQRTLFLSHALTVDPYNFNNIIQDYAVGLSCFDLKTRGKKRRISMKPFYIDFFPPSSSHLAKRSSGDAGPDLLTKAVSPRKGFTNGGAVVYDLTAGFGQDALLIALAGANRVQMVERNPVVATLLEDALRRLELISKQTVDVTARTAAITLSNRLSFECGDGTRVMESLIRQSNPTVLPEIIYLDPMFAARRKIAAVKKNMQNLHGPLEAHEVRDETRQLQEEALLRLAYDAGKTRVVVKRPVNAPLLGCPEREQLRPSYQISNTINRWDVFVKTAADNWLVTAVHSDLRHGLLRTCHHHCRLLLPCHHHRSHTLPAFVSITALQAFHIPLLAVKPGCHKSDQLAPRSAAGDNLESEWPRC